MSVIDSLVDTSDETARPKLEAALAGIAQATSFYDFENAWITGLRMVTGSNGHEDGNRVLAAAGERLHVLGELQDDVARRGWLRHIAETVKFRGDDWIGGDLERVAAREAREAFARVIGDLTELRESVASGESLNEFAARRPRPADRLRDLGGIAEALRSSGLLSLCDEDDCGLARNLARAMSAPVHLVPTVPEPLRVSRDDLIGWAQTSEAAAQFPRLVRSLVAETEPSAEWIDVPAGTGAALPGWDGIVRCARGNRFVPLGKSAWELTTQQGSVKKKADCDYAKRLEESTADERAEVAYVAAACAPWTKRRDFESERTGEGDFDRVLALNVDAFEDWLSCAVATTVWMRDQLGKPTEGIVLLTKWWEHWLAATTTPLDEGLVLAGREKAAVDLREHCSNGRGIVTVGGQVHREEIIAFIAAALDGGGSDGTSAEQVLYVDSHATAERLFAQEAVSIPPGLPSVGLVLTMVVPSPEFATHLPAGSPHRMIVPVPGSPQAAIKLDAVNSDVVDQRLQAVGFEPHEAHQLGGVARTSLMALRRCLAVEPALHTPSWATGHIDMPLRRCLMLGGWNGTRPGDREVVERFTGKPYSEVTDLLSQINPADAPLAAVVEQWHSVSPAATWVLVRAHLTSDDIKEFAETAHEVLTAADPLLEMSAEDALSARMNGVQAKFSPELRQGLATSLALAGSLPLEAAERAPQASTMASNVTSWLLRSAMDDPTPRTWTALADVLPLLAEADPDALLRSLRTCVSKQHAFTRAMFTDSGDVWLSSLPPSPHFDILRALETVAWSPDHLFAAVDILARLAEIDSGNTHPNRPTRSLASIMCPWLPHTSADLETRLAAVRGLVRSHNAVAWRLMLTMLPNRHDTQSDGPHPRFRDWRPAQPAMSRREHRDTVEATAALLVDHAGTDADRWSSLVMRLSDLPAAARSDAATALDQLAAADPTEQFKATLWPVLRERLASHRQFHYTQWALPEADLQPLDQVLERLRPSDPVGAFGHLFSTGLFHIDRVAAVDRDGSFEDTVQERREEAVCSVLKLHGLDGVLRLAQGVQVPRWVGMTLAVADPTLDADVLASMGDASAPVAQTCVGYFSVRFADLGWAGIELLIADSPLSPQAAADLLRSAPAPEHAWNRLDRFGADVAAEYWARVTHGDLGYPKDLEQLLDLSRRLRSAGRLDLVPHLLAAPSQDHLAELAYAEEAAAFLAQCLRHPDVGGGDSSDMRRWELTGFFEVLDVHREQLGTDRVALLEWQYYPLLQDEPGFSAPNLYRKLARDPDFFVHLVECAYKPPANATSGEDYSVDEQQQRLALNAWQVLSTWPTDSFVPRIVGEPAVVATERTAESAEDAADGPAAERYATVDQKSLNSWVERARAHLAEIDRSAVGDLQIGAALAATPADPNGDWPGVAVRCVLESLQSDHIDDGISETLYNRRGVTSRGVTEGGAQERELAEDYRARSGKFQGWPRTAAIFAGLACSYKNDARVIDLEAEAQRRGPPL